MGIKITDLLPIDSTSVTDNDVLPIVDLESQATKKITIRKLREGVLAIDNGPQDPNDIESQHGVLLELSPNTGGLSADFNLTKLRTRFGALGSLHYDPVTGFFSYNTPDSDGITEGTQHLYYSDERARHAISVTGAGLSYNPTTGVIGFNQGDPGAVTHVGGFTFDGFTISAEPAVITGYIVGDKLHIVNLVSGDPSSGETVTGPGVTPGTTLVSIFTPGTPSPDGDLGGAGSVWTVSVSQTVGTSNSPVSMSLGDGDFVLDPSGANVKVAGPLKLADDTIQTTAFPGYAGWTHTDNVAFTTTGIGKKVSLNYGSNSVFVDTTGVSLRGGASSIKVNTSGQLVFPDSTTQVTAFNITAVPNSAVLFKSNGNISSSTNFTYLNDELNVNTINAKDINFTGSGTVDISSNSNLQISAVGTISINGAYTIPTSAGLNRKVLTTNGTNAATWEYAGADAEYAGPSNTIWSTRQYNGGATVTYRSDNSDSANVTNAINSSPGSEIFVNINSFPKVQQVPTGAVVNGSGLTNAHVVTSMQDITDPSLWRLVVDQTGTFTTTSAFAITWGDAGTGPVTWWDANNSPLYLPNFRGAVVEYQALVGDGAGVIVGTIIISNSAGDNNVVHHESTSGNNSITNYSFYNVSNESKLQFSGGALDNTAVVHFTSRVFYGPASL